MNIDDLLHLQLLYDEVDKIESELKHQRTWIRCYIESKFPLEKDVDREWVEKKINNLQRESHNE